MAELIETGFCKGNQVFAPAHFAQLPGGFQSGGMRKPAGGKRGVDQLPGQPVGNAAGMPWRI